jgi:hypothetical protein
MIQLTPTVRILVAIELRAVPHAGAYPVFAEGHIQDLVLRRRDRLVDQAAFAHS